MIMIELYIYFSKIIFFCRVGNKFFINSTVGTSKTESTSLLHFTLIFKN